MLNGKVNLHQLVNLWDVAQDGSILGMSGEAAVLYRVRPARDATLMDEPSCLNYIRSAGHILASLAPEASLSFLIEVMPEESPHLKVLKERAELAEGAVKELLGSRLEAVRRTPEAAFKMHLCLAVHPSDFLKLPLLTRTLFPSRGIREIGKRHTELRERLKILEELVAAQMGECAGIKRLNREEVVSFYWRALNPSRAESGIGPMPGKPYISLRSRIALSPVRDEKDHFWMDGYCHRGISLLYLGEDLELGGTDRLISRLPFGSRAAFHFMGVDLERALDRAKAQARRSEGLSFLSGSKNYEAQAKASELDELVTLVRSSGERLLIASVCLIIRDRDPDLLRNRTMEAVALLRESLGSEALMEDLEHKRLFLASLPLGAPASPRKHTLTGEASAHLVPLSAPWEGCSSPGILFGTREGRTVSLDPFEGDTPRHGIVIGSTGSGKSFTMNYLVSSLFAMDPSTRFVIVDVGGSYKKLCAVLGGEYFEISLTGEFTINPFPSREAILDAKNEFDPDLAGYLTLLIEKMLEGKSGQNRRRIIEKGIRILYASSGLRVPRLGDFVSALNQFPGDERDKSEAGEIARELRLFTEGSYGAIFNQAKQTDAFQGRLAVFDLAKLKEHKHLQGILITVIGFGLAQSMARKDLRKVVILDEGWEFFDEANASELVSRLYRTARKFNGMIISVSQSPRDFLKSQASTAMLANSYWKAVLRLDMGHEELSGLGLNPRQIETVRSLTMKKGEYSELLAVFGENSRVLRLKPAPLEYWISTTNARECAMEEALACVRQGKSRLDILKDLAANEEAAR